VKLVVEVDGEIHKDKKEYDDGRTAEMERFGIQVIRFTIEEIKNQIDEVIRKIECTINERINNPSWKL
jgi:very-short-patch-repair endonuclease